MYSLRSKVNNEPYVYVRELNGIRTPMEIDTGAAITIISVQQLKKLEQGNKKLSISKDGVPQLRTYTGELLQTLGRVWLEVRSERKTCTLPALVAPGAGPCLIGRDWVTLE